MPAAPPYLPAAPDPDEDWLRDDPALARFVRARVSEATWRDASDRLSRLGVAAPREVDPLARRADARPPRLEPDGALVFDPAYRALQRLARAHRVFSYAWHVAQPQRAEARVAGFALGYLFAQAECGYYCPACMTDGAAFVLSRRAPEALARRLVPRLVQDEVEDAFEGAMFLTEPQGGSDVGATRTAARPAEDGAWRLTGDKWFASNAGAQVILTLARMPGAPGGTRGLGLFVVPARLPDATPNPGLRLVRLKDKLGVRSMATAEVELREAHAWLVAGEGEGFAAMTEMVNLSRLHNTVASVGIARRALREGQRNGRHRMAFGRPLREHPLYARVVAELANDVRAALLLVLDAAQAFGRAAEGDEEAYRLLRALTPLAKSETAELAVRAASQGCELLGGNGYVEEWVTPRLLRDAQVLPIWEGTTHVQALDFLRACRKEDAMRALLADSLGRLSGARPEPLARAVGEAWRQLAAEMQSLADPEDAQLRARRWVARAYALRAATLLLEDARRDDDPDALAHAEAFVLREVARDAPAFEARLGGRLARLAGF